MYAAIAFFMIMLLPLFAPLGMVGADAVNWIYVRLQKLIRKQGPTFGPSTDERRLPRARARGGLTYRS
jgi:hypothetical protein